MKARISILLVIFNFALAFGQTYNLHNHPFKETLRTNARTTIQIPDILGYKTMKCDFHIHTIFSDGDVTPEVRVKEAWCEGLDAIAITDHNKLKKDFYAADYNKSYDLAKVEGDDKGLIVIKGVEFTQGKPVGHYNFLFIDDANQYESGKIEASAALDLAASKGAFVIWNHPGWPDNNCQLYDFQKGFIAQKKIGAIEIFNHEEFYPLAIDFIRDNNLAPIGCSDIHLPINFYYDFSVTRRPMTLVFSKNRTEEGIKEALIAGRTIAYFNNLLAGNEEYINALFLNSLDVVKLEEEADQTNFKITNHSDITYYLESPDSITIFPARGVVQMKIKKTDFNKVYSLKNSFCRSQTHANVTLPLENLYQVISGWNLETVRGPVTGNVNATMMDNNLDSTVIGRGAGLGTTGSLFYSYVATAPLMDSTKAEAISNNEYFQIKIKIKDGFKMDLSSLNYRFRRTSTGPASYSWAYSLNGVDFTEIVNEDTTLLVSSEGAFYNLDFSGIAELKNVKVSEKGLILRMYVWGASSNTAVFGFGRHKDLTSEHVVYFKGKVEADVPSANVKLNSSDADLVYYDKAANKLVVKTSESVSQSSSVVVFDMLGKEIYRVSVLLNPGTNFLNLPNAIGKGMYIVKINGDKTGKASSRIIR